MEWHEPHFSLTEDKNGWELGGRNISKQEMLARGPSGVGDEGNAHKSKSPTILEAEGASKITGPVDFC